MSRKLCRRPSRSRSRGAYGFHVVSDPRQKRHSDRRRDCWRRQAAHALGGNEETPCLDDADIHVQQDYKNESDPGPSLDRIRAGTSHRFVAAYPHDPNALAFRGLSSHLNGDNEAAVPYLTKSLRRGPVDVALLVQLRACLEAARAAPRRGGGVSDWLSRRGPRFYG